MKRRLPRRACWGALAAALAALAAPAAPAAEGPIVGLADAAALRATVFGTPPQDVAPLPARVPLLEIDVDLPRPKPVPEIFWFDRALTVWLSAQTHPAPLAIVISGTGGDGNTSKQSLLRAVLYGAGYHVLSLPSPTFPGFIVAASSTGVAGDLEQDGEDLYAALRYILPRLPKKVRITDIDILGYSLGGANAAMVKAIDTKQGMIGIHRAVMVNPPVSLFNSIGRLDQLFANSVGPGDDGLERLYRRMYARLANLYRASDRVQVDSGFLLGAAAQVLRSDGEISAAIALTFRLDLVDMFFAGDLYAGTGVVIDPRHPPRVGDSLEAIGRTLRDKSFADYFDGVFAPYYLQHRPGATPASLMADNRLEVIGDLLRSDPDYYAQTNRDELILDQAELEWLESALGARIAVYDHGGHLGNLGDRRQAADMLDMLAGRFTGTAR